MEREHRHLADDLYDVEGTGTDFLQITQIKGINVPAGNSTTLGYRRTLTQKPYKIGKGGIDVTLQQLPNHSSVTGKPSPDATAPISVSA